MKKCSEKIFFENIGGSFQFHVKCAADLCKITSLDSTAWAALCVPVKSLNGAPEFFKAIDNDNNGMIRVDEVKSAVDWLLGVLADFSAVDKAEPAISVSMLNKENVDGKALGEFIETFKSELENGSKMVDIAAVRAKIAAVKNGALSGDGMLKAKAVDIPEAVGLYTDITTIMNCPDQLTTAVLDKFLADAKSFVEWSKTVEKPRFRDDEPEKYFAVYQALSAKIDEYFRYCELVCIDPAHAKRFELDPAALPELDLLDGGKIDSILQNAPLAKPDGAMVLDLNAVNNPLFRKSAAEFIQLFNVTELSYDAWQSLKAEFAAYAAYIGRIQSDPVGKLGVEKLEAYLPGTEAELLRKIFLKDQAVAGVLENLAKLERLLLFCRYMLSFVNNFVSFSEFFDHTDSSMLQAGRLVMDGRSYHLAVWIDDPAAHKKIAIRSNMCLLYLELVSSGVPAVTRKAAVAVTGGSLDRIYVGKPAYFIDNDNISYTGKVVDMVEGPISFGQTLFAPFRRLSAALGNKIQKLTDFSATEKQLAQSIEQGKVVPATPAAPAKPGFVQKLGGNGVMMLLAGGLSLAAVGAGLSFVFKSIASGIATISALPWYVILSWVAVFAAIILVPLAIFASLRMRKRNLTMFLEAGGWAVNLPMRLSMTVSRLFTRGTEYPAGSRFAVIKKPGQRVISIIITMILLIIIAGAVWYICWKYQIFPIEKWFCR